jgi:hypothetical protein
LGDGSVYLDEIRNVLGLLAMLLGVVAVALADDAKALPRNEQVRKTYLGETD